MFIRRTRTRSTPSGQIWFTHRLVRSHRVAGKATRAETDQKANYDALGIDPAAGGIRKMIF